MGRWWMGKGAWPCLLLVVLPSDSTSAAAGCPRSLLLALTGTFSPMIPSPGGLPPGSRMGRAPSLGLPRGGTSTLHPLCFHGGISSAPSFPCSAPPGSQAGSCSPSFRLRCGVTQRSRSPSGGSISSSRSPSYGGISTSLPAMPCTQGTQRVGLGSHGSLSLASESDASGSLGQCWCSAHNRQRSLSFVRVNAQGSTSPASAFSAMPASLKSSMASRITGGFPGINSTPPVGLQHAGSAASRA